MAFANLMGWVEDVTPAKTFLTFVIIIVIQFVVITKGSGRIAEVAIVAAV